MSALGDLIRSERTRNGWTLQAVADRCGFSKAYLSDVEKDNRHPTTDTFLSAIADALSIDPDVVYYYAGLIPPDLRGLDMTPDQIRNAFSVFRAVLNGAPLPEQIAA